MSTFSLKQRRLIQILCLYGYRKIGTQQLVISDFRSFLFLANDTTVPRILHGFPLQTTTRRCATSTKQRRRRYMYCSLTKMPTSLWNYSKYLQFTWNCFLCIVYSYILGGVESKDCGSLEIRLPGTIVLVLNYKDAQAMLVDPQLNFNMLFGKYVSSFLRTRFESL